MNGYLMQERQWTPGEDLFAESFSPESPYGVVFEDDGQTAYFYAVEKDKEGESLRVLDALHIRETGAESEEEEDARASDPGSDSAVVGQDRSAEGRATQKPSRLQIVWSRDWMKSALVIDGLCHALFDFIAHGGYNINEFPPPNEFWTQGDRKLTMELMQKLF
jgi:hypothetical protein